MLTISCCLASLLCAATASDEGRIRPSEEHPRYWQYKGQTLMLLGGSEKDSLFHVPALEEHLDEMRAVGANYIRNTISDRKDRGYECWRVAQLADGRYDLDKWNDAYWQHLENLLRWTEEREIIVQIEVWDRFDYSQDNWVGHPYNPKNNVNYTHEESGLAAEYTGEAYYNEQPFFFTTPEQQNNVVVLAHQRRFVDKLLSHTLRYAHVLYCMDNETSGEEAWSAYWAEYIRARAAEVGREVCLTEMWDEWDIKGDTHRRTLDHPERYDFADVSQNNQKTGQEHWDNFQWARAHVAGRPWPLNTVKTYGADGGPFYDSQEGVERWWRHVIGGAASARFHRPPHGLGRSARAHGSIRAARKLEEVVRFWDLEPANARLSSREENEAYLTAKAGDVYVLYFTKGGSVTVDLADAPETLRLRWLDISSGEWADESSVAGAGALGVEAQDNRGWLAVITE